MAIEHDPVLSEAGRPVSAFSLLDVDIKSEHSGLRNALEWVVIAGGALLVALIIKTFLLQAFYIPSLSMASTLKVNDRVVVNKLSYDLHDINRGDVVVFESPPNEGSRTKDLIKRLPDGKGAASFADQVLQETRVTWKGMRRCGQ